MNGQMGWGQTASRGAAVGVVSVGVYALAFLGYAVTRATARLLTTPDIDGGLAATIAATWLSLAVPVAVFAILCALPAALLGVVTALLMRGLLVRIPRTWGWARAMLVGGGLCATISFTLLALLASQLGLAWTRGTGEAITFWLALPLVVYTLAGALAGGRLQRALFQ